MGHTVGLVKKVLSFIQKWKVHSSLLATATATAWADIEWICILEMAQLN